MSIPLAAVIAFSFSAGLAVILLLVRLWKSRRSGFKTSLRLERNEMRSLHTALAKYQTPPRSPPANRPLDVDIEPLITMAVEKVLRKYKIPGCVLQICKNGFPKIELAIGMSSKESGHHIRTTESFRIGSITKSMTATCILLLAKMKRLSLNNALADFPFSNDVLLPSNAKDITILQLLNMTSGIPHYESNPSFSAIFTQDPLVHWNPKDLVRWSVEMSTKGTQTAPGKVWDYCNTGYIYAGLIIEMITKMPCHEAFEHLLFKPLGMHDTYLATNAIFRAPHSQGYGDIRDKLENVTAWSPMWGWTAGGVVSTLADMSKWAENIGQALLLKDYATQLSDLALNPMLDETGLETSHTDKHLFNMEYFYGLGVIYDHHWVWHNGSIPGWESVVAYNRANNTSIMLNVNQSQLPNNHSVESPATELFRDVVEIISPDMLLHPIDPA